MNGHVIPDTPIAVDFWKLRNRPDARVFFLTHYHTDHMVGLTSSWPYPIYCSSVTGKLLVHHMGIKPDLVRTLEVNESHVVGISEKGEETVTVSVFDACHCPGSVIFLFQGYFGKVLYTGDFRFAKEKFTNHEMWQNCKEPDILFLDNTYLDPSCLFPAKEVAKMKIFDLIDSHKDYDIVFGMHPFGKEDLLIDISLRYGVQIAVDKAFLDKVKLLCLPAFFTDKPSDTNLRVSNLHSISSQQVKEWNTVWPTIVILVTSIYSGLRVNPFSNFKNVFIVQYSNHSSYLELLDFVNLIKPKKIKPIVTGNRGPMGSDVSNRISMRLFDELLSKVPQTSYKVPPCVLKYMKDGRILDLASDQEKKTTNNRVCHKQNGKIARRKRTRGVVFHSSTPEKRNANDQNLENDSHKADVASTNSPGNVCCNSRKLFSKSNDSCALQSPSQPIVKDIELDDNKTKSLSASMLDDELQIDRSNSGNKELLTGDSSTIFCDSIVNGVTRHAASNKKTQAAGGYGKIKGLPFRVKKNRTREDRKRILYKSFEIFYNK